MYVVGEAEGFSIDENGKPVLTPVIDGGHFHNAPGAPHAFVPKVGMPKPDNWEIAFIAITPRNLKEDTHRVSEEVRALYAGWHPIVRGLLGSVEETFIWALHDRPALPRWSTGRCTLLGDACHPMLPFMAQGAGMAIEDAVVLGRALAGVSTRVEAVQALQRYENARKERTAKIQIGSRGNQWMKGPGNADWVYGYDAWNVPLAS